MFSHFPKQKFQTIERTGKEERQKQQEIELSPLNKTWVFSDKALWGYDHL